MTTVIVKANLKSSLQNVHIECYGQKYVAQIPYVGLTVCEPRQQGVSFILWLDWIFFTEKKILKNSDGLA